MATTKKPPTTPVRIYEQIEENADFYTPDVYDLLGRHNVLKTEADPLGPDFIPLTATRPRRKSDSILFAVGLIPPSANITGRLLDRSATVAAIEGYTEQTVATAGGVSAQQQTFGTDATLPAAPVAGGSTQSTLGTPVSPDDVDFWAKYVAMCKRLQIDPKELARVLNSESKFSPGSVNRHTVTGQPQAKGLNQITKSTGTAMGMPPGYWDTYENVSATEQLIWVEKYFRGSKGATAGQLYRKNFGGYNNPNGSLYDKTACAKGYVNCKFQEVAYQQNLGLDKDNKGYITGADLEKILPVLPTSLAAGIAAGEAALANNPNLGATTSWQGQGAANAQQAQKAASTLANRDLNQTALGQALTAQQQAQIRALQLALDQMARTPPLRMRVNPISFKVGEEKVVADGTWSRQGPIVEHWGEAQTKISASGKLAGFYSMDAAGTPLGSPGNSPGLGRMARNFSASYQNFLSLYLIYKNNGGIWIDDLSDPTTSKPNNLALVGSVYLYYDHTLYIGSFDSFNVTESDDKPFTLEYDFEFTVRATFLLDPVADPRGTLGAPDVFGASTGRSGLPGARDALIGDTGVFGPVMSEAEIAANEARIIADGERAIRERELAPKDPGNIFADPPLSNKELANQLFKGQVPREKPLDPSTSRVLVTPKKGK